jgi:DNA-binding CsgD family transcriptional regulator
MLARHGFDEAPPPAVDSALWLLPARMALRSAQGRHDAAVADADDILARLARRGHSVLLHGSAIALVLLAAGRGARARKLAEEHLALARRWGALGNLGRAQRAYGIVVGGADGIGLLEEAAATLERTRCKLELAKCLGALGAALRRANRRADAREPLQRALDLASRCGAEPLAATLLDELRACGARPRRLVLTGLESLTPSERRVAALVAQGLSNPEVAQSLFVTRATVETHLRSVYRKLHVDSRRDLSAFFSEPSENLMEARGREADSVAGSSAA